jgi:hypothetical protein
VTTLLEIRPAGADLQFDHRIDDVASARIAVEVIVCGAIEHGDDGAPIEALRGTDDALAPDVEVRIVAQLAIDDLLAVPYGAGVVVVDSALGIDQGWIVQMPFAGLAGRESGVRPRSARALEIPETVGLASMIRGRPPVGIAVIIGGATFGLGEALSWPVSAGMTAFRLAIADAIDRVRAQVRLDAIVAKAASAAHG